MAPSLSTIAGVFAVAVAVFSGTIYPAVQRKLTILGIGKTLRSSHHGDLVRIANTLDCEDMHYWAPSHQIFAACQVDTASRRNWFPGVAQLSNATVAWNSRGMITVIDPETKKSTALTFTNFDHPFNTHGMDIASDPAAPENSSAVYIFVINHLPNPRIFPQDGSIPPLVTGKHTPHEIAKVRSQVEVFHHVIGSTTIRHLRSIHDPLIRTPNDLYAVSPTDFYVTNDHFYREGNGRLIEDLWSGAAWTDVVHVKLDSASLTPPTGKSLEPTEGIKVTVAKDGLYTANGLAHGRTPSELLLASCNGGELYLCDIAPTSPSNITTKDTIRVEGLVDNPFYFKDPYPLTYHDASGFLLPGTTRPLDLGKETEELGAEVWYVKPTPGKPAKEWEKSMLFEDDGKRIKCGTTAILVGVDPAKESDRKKRGWLFVTGFYADNVIAVKVDL